MRKWAPVLRASAITFGGGLLFALVGGILAGYGGEAGWFDGRAAEQIVLAVFAVILMAGALWIGAAWMQVIDEAAREAHKAAWYWGGTGGMCVGGVGLILASGDPWREVIAGWIGAGGAPVDYVAAGAILMLLPMLVGYTLVWAWWWLARMRG